MCLACSALPLPTLPSLLYLRLIVVLSHTLPSIAELPRTTTSLTSLPSLLRRRKSTTSLTSDLYPCVRRRHVRANLLPGASDCQSAMCMSTSNQTCRNNADIDLPTQPLKHSISSPSPSMTRPPPSVSTTTPTASTRTFPIPIPPTTTSGP
jgi:hypothetical protein